MKFSELLEAVTPISPEMSIEDAFIELNKRLGAAKEGLGIANKLKNKEERNKHLSRVLSNLNTLRAQLNRSIKQVEAMTKPESDFVKTRPNPVYKGPERRKDRRPE